MRRDEKEKIVTVKSARKGERIMKKRMKRTMALLFAVTMILGMSGCSMGNETKDVVADNTEKTDDGEKKVAYISAANQFDFFVYIGAQIKKQVKKTAYKWICLMRH